MQDLFFEGILSQRGGISVNMVNSYVAVDLETTGLNPKQDKIIEIGAVRVLDGEIEETRTYMVDPRRELEERITGLTGIKDQDLAGAPGIETVIGPVLEFCSDLPLLGHQIIFDYSFLKRAAVNQGMSFEKDGIDTLKLCRRFMPEEEKKNLSLACRYFGIVHGREHRAFEDALAAHLLYQELKSRFGELEPEAFSVKTLIYKVKKEQLASKRQKEHLRDLIKYHKISLTVQIDYLTRNEISRITDKIISQYGRITVRKNIREVNKDDKF